MVLSKSKAKVYKAPVSNLFDEDYEEKEKSSPVVTNTTTTIQSVPESEQGKVVLGLPQFLQLLKNYYKQVQIAELSDQIPTSEGVLIKEIEIDGKDATPAHVYAEPSKYLNQYINSFAKLKCTFKADVLDRTMPQGNSTLMAAEQSKGFHSAAKVLQQRSAFNDESEQADRSSWFCCSLVRNVRNSIVLEQWSVTKESSSPQQQDNVYIGVLNNQIVFLCSEPGRYKLELHLLVSYVKRPEAGKLITSAPKELRLDIHKAVKNFLKFEIPQDGVQAKVTPALYPKLTVDEDSSSTIVSCALNPCSSFSVIWTPKIEYSSYLEASDSESEEELSPTSAKEEKQPLVISVEQSGLHAIGEGLVKTTAVFDYTISNGSVTTLNISANSNGHPFKIVNVKGSGIKKWEVVKEIDEENMTEAEDLQKAEFQKNIVVYLTYGMENSYRLTVETETEMGGTSAKVFVPTFSCRHVTREVGTVAVVARTNVEIKEESCKYLNRVDPSELPSVQHASPFPILHAYKLLDTNYTLRLDVTRHDDIPVCSACMDEVYYQVSHSDGVLVHSITMKIMNTGKQYLRVRLPDIKGEIWTTSVNGDTVKPSAEIKENNRYILIPLSTKEEMKAIFAKIVFPSNTPAMKKNGLIRIEFARFDIPILKLMTSVYLPFNYKYGEFEGNLREISHYFTYPITVTDQQPPTSSASQVRRNSNNLRRALRDKKEEKKKEKRQQMEIEEQNIYLEDLDDMSESINFSKSMDIAADIGVKPVSMSTFDTTGKEFRFEKFLIMENEALVAKVAYKEIKKSWFEKRNIEGSPLKFVMMTLLVLLVLVVLVSIFIRFFGAEQFMHSLLGEYWHMFSNYLPLFKKANTPEQPAA